MIKIEQRIQDLNQEYNKVELKKPADASPTNLEFLRWQLALTNWYDLCHEANQAKKRGCTHWDGKNFIKKG